MEGVEYLSHMGPDALGHLCENMDYLMSLISLQLTYLVVGLHHLRRLYIDGLSRCTLIVDDTRNLALHPRRDGNDKSSVANSGCDILVNDALALRRVQDAVQNARHRPCHTRHLTADTQQLGRGVIADMTELIHDLVYLLDEDGEGSHTVGKVVEGGIVPHGNLRNGILLATVEELHQVIDGLQRALQVKELVLFHPGILHTHPLDAVAHVEDISQGEVVTLLANTPHLAYLLHPGVYLLAVVRESHLGDKAFAKGGQAVGSEHVTHLAKAKLSLEIIGIYHIFPLFLFPYRSNIQRLHGHILNHDDVISPARSPLRF